MEDSHTSARRQATSSKKISSLAFHIPEYLIETDGLSAAALGALVRLELHATRSDGTLPDDDKQLARLARMTTANFRKVKPQILALCEQLCRVADGVMHFTRVAKEIAFALAKSARQKAKAEFRWSAKSNTQTSPSDASGKPHEASKSLKNNNSDDATAMPRQCPSTQQEVRESSLRSDSPPQSPTDFGAPNERDEWSDCFVGSPPAGSEATEGTGRSPECDQVSCPEGAEPVREPEQPPRGTPNTRKPRTKGVKRMVPDDWKPSEATRNWCYEELGMTEQEVWNGMLRFKNGCAAKGYMYVNFDAAFKNWMLSDHERKPKSNPNRGTAYVRASNAPAG